MFCFLERAILCPQNNEMDEINDEVLKQFLGEETLFQCRLCQRAEEGDHYPLEYSNSIAMSDLPPSQLKLKLGVPLMLL